MAVSFISSRANSPMHFRGREDRLSGGSLITENSGSSSCRAYSCSAATVLSPMERLGVLMIRTSDTSSAGFTTRRRYARASRTSLRS